MATATASSASQISLDGSMTSNAAHALEDGISNSISPPPESSFLQGINVGVSASGKASTPPLQPIASTSATKIESDSLPSSTKLAEDPVKSQSAPIAQVRHTNKEFDQDAELLASLASVSNNIKNDGDQALLNAEEELEDPFTLPCTMQSLAELENEDSSGPIQAYAKLEFPGFSYYIQTLECTIGRRPAHMRSPPNTEGSGQHIIGFTKQEGDVDVDLGLLKSISRLHVRIFYQDQSQLHSAYPPGMFDHMLESIEKGNTGRFVLQVLGRNGCFVDDVPVAKNVIIPLGKRTKIQIAERVFYFVLPPPPSNRRYNSDGEIDSGESLGNLGEEDEEDRKSEDVDNSESLGSSESEEEEKSAYSSEIASEEKLDEKIAERDSKEKNKSRPKLVLKRKGASVEQREGKEKGKGKHQGKTVWPGQGTTMVEKALEQDEQGTSDGKGKFNSNKAKVAKKELELASNGSRKRKREDVVDSEQKAKLKVGTLTGVEAIAGKKKRRKRKGEEEEGDMNMQEKEPIAVVKGKGKNGGKALVVAAAVAAKAKADEEKEKAKTKGISSKVKDDSSLKISAPSSAAVKQAARPAAMTSSTGASTQHRMSPQPNSFTRPPKPSNSSIRPLPASTPKNAYKGSMSDTRPAIVPRPLANGVASPSNYSPSPVLQTAASTGASLMPLSNANSPMSSSANSTALLLPTGSGIKPELNNMDLIRNALANPLSLRRGGKLTLTEIYEDISSRYEWYRTNNRANGKDWHGVIRQAVGNSKEMIRIPRKDNEHGKGAFYALTSSPAAQLYRRELGANPGQSMEAASASTLLTTPIGATMANTAMSSTPSKTSVSSTSPSNLIPLGTSPHSAAAAAAAADPTSSTKQRLIQTPTRPSPPNQANGRVSIMIGKAPAEALAQMAATPKAAITQNIEALFGGPPIVHHEGKLYLSPLVFGHMSAKEINDIGGKGAQQALAILQGHLVSHLQGKMKKSNSPAPKLPAKKQEANNGTVTKQPAAAPPPLQQQPRPPQIAANTNSAISLASPVHGSSIRPPHATATVTSNIRPQVTSRPAPSSTAARPSIGSNLVRPAAVNIVAANTSRPMARSTRPLTRPPASENTVRPAPNQISSRAILPCAGQGARPRPMAEPNPTPSMQSSSSNVVRPLVNVLRPAARPSNARPNAPATIGNQVGPLMPVVQVIQSRPRSPIVVKTSAATNSSKVAQVDTNQSSSTSLVKDSSNTSLSIPNSNAMLSAMQALASHPDAAGLMTLLNGDKVNEGSKLTPGQLDLLQQAGRIAAKQQRTQQQEDQKPSTSSVPSSTSELNKDDKKITTTKTTIDDTKGKAKDAT